MTFLSLRSRNQSDLSIPTLCYCFFIFQRIFKNQWLSKPWFNLLQKVVSNLICLSQPNVNFFLSIIIYSWERVLLQKCVGTISRAVTLVTSQAVSTQPTMPRGWCRSSPPSPWKAGQRIWWWMWSPIKVILGSRSLPEKHKLYTWFGQVRWRICRCKILWVQ